MEQFISSYEEACAKLGRTTELPDVSKWPERLQKHLLATFKLDTILEVNNGGWVPDIANKKEWKYWPWFNIIKDESCPGGFRLSLSGCDYDCAYSFLGVRLACKSSDLAEFMGENCTELYKDLNS